MPSDFLGRKAEKRKKGGERREGLRKDGKKEGREGRREGREE